MPSSAEYSGAISHPSISVFQEQNQCQPNQTSQTHQSKSSVPFSCEDYPSVPPAAVFQEPTDKENRMFQSQISDMVELTANSKNINLILPCISNIKESLRCSFLYHILVDYLHLYSVGQIQRRSAANVVAFLFKNNFISIEHFKLAYAHFCELASELILDVPALWLYIFEFIGKLLYFKLYLLSLLT